MADQFSNPDFWNNLMQFGFGAMSAGAEPGATTLGALGQGGMQAMKYANDTKEARAKNQYMGQQTLKDQLENASSIRGMNARNEYMGLPTVDSVPGIPDNLLARNPAGGLAAPSSSPVAGMSTTPPQTGAKPATDANTQAYNIKAIAFGPYMPKTKEEALAALNMEGIPKQKADILTHFINEKSDTVTDSFKQLLRPDAADTDVSNLTGEDLLKYVNPKDANVVKLLNEGKMKLSDLGNRSSYRTAISQLAAQAYPDSYDTINSGTRAKVQADFASGASRKTINSIETALIHTAALQDANDKLGGWATGNTLRNVGLSMENDPDLNTYNTIAKTAADEVSKATAGALGSTESDRKDRLKSVTADQSPESRKAGIDAMVTLLNGRLEPLANAYTSGMGKSVDGISLLSPEAQAAYKKIMGVPSDNTNVGDKKSDNAQPTPKPENTAILKAYPDAKQASDGNYYIPDKRNSGKYLMVQP